MQAAEPSSLSFLCLSSQHETNKDGRVTRPPAPPLELRRPLFSSLWQVPDLETPPSASDLIHEVKMLGVV